MGKTEPLELSHGIKHGIKPLELNRGIKLGIKMLGSTHAPEYVRTGALWMRK
jgi:hypothetical protein